MTQNNWFCWLESIYKLPIEITRVFWISWNNLCKKNSNYTFYFLNSKLWKTTISNVIILRHRISKIQLISLEKLTGLPANFTVDQYISLINQWVSLMESGTFHWFLYGRLITFETVVSHCESVSFYCFGFRNTWISQKLTELKSVNRFSFLSKCELVNFSLIESVIWIFTHTPVKRIFSTVKSVNFDWFISGKNIFRCWIS